MAANPEDIYEQIANADTAGGGNYVKDGRYKFVVRRLILECGRNNKWRFVAELRVLSSEAVDVVDRNADEEGKELKPNAPGSDVSFFVPIYEEWGPGKAKTFLCALDGTDPKTVSGDSPEAKAAFVSMLKRSTQKEQPLRGAVIAMNTYRKQSVKGKNPGKWGTRENWEHIPQTIADITKRRAELDAVPEAAAF